MFIKQITLNNFRIYHGVQAIGFERDAGRNIHIVSGNNGYGKTSFLNSLVWCLYGKNMQDVDESYKSNISDLGGYKKYLQSCLNQASSASSDFRFYVRIVFSDLTIPGFAYNEISIERKYDTASEQEELIILIDNQENELINDVGSEMFINDFILPKEIARFFFFDAEKNVSLAEMHSLTDRKNLSKAYSEILGIKKYEELKQNLSDMRLRYRKESAGVADAEKLTRIDGELVQLEKLKKESEEKIIELTNEKSELKLKADRLQEKLIREGSTVSLDQIKKMQSEKNKLGKEYEMLKMKFTELVELAPFAIAGNLLAEVEDQLMKENEEKIDRKSQRLIDRKLKTVIEELKAAKPDDFIADRKTKNFYISTLNGLLEEHFAESENKESEKLLLRLKVEELSQFSAIMQNLRSSYRLQLSDVNRLIRTNRFEFNKYSKKLIDAEAKESDELIQNFRSEKNSVEEKIINLENELVEEFKKSGSYDHQFNSKKKVYEELSKKVQLQDRYKDKDELAERVIANLDTFLLRIKNEKRTSLEARILEGLQALMHKQNFVTKVKVNIAQDIIDISLFNAKGEIKKENLSKGEQQLYATALLKALVEESNIRFPVFVDSPMQKYDTIHSVKVITQFYPTISEQVVVFPLLHKEMTKVEYDLLLPYVKSVHLIENNGGFGSTFRCCKPDELFKDSNTVPSYVKQYQDLTTE